MIPVPAMMALTWARNNKGQAVIGAVAVAFLIAASVQTVRLGWAHRTVEKLKAEVVELNARYDAAVARAKAEKEAAEARDRAKEAKWKADTEKAHAEWKRSLDAEKARSAALARDNQQLRTIADAYARGPIGGAGDTVEACRARATALGQLFSDAVEEAGRMAQAADRHADEVRLCLSAWPQ